MYGIITEQLYKRLIQTTKHKRKSHDHFSKFLVTAIYEFEARTATLSAWHVIRQLVFLSTRPPFVIFQPFNTIFIPRKLYLRASISNRNCPTKLNTQFQIRISFCSLSHIPFGSPLPVPANILCLTVRTRIVRTFDSYCHTFKAAFSLNISISRSVDFAFPCL